MGLWAMNGASVISMAQLFSPSAPFIPGANLQSENGHPFTQA
jgi:hypothetical protein